MNRLHQIVLLTLLTTFFAGCKAMKETCCPSDSGNNGCLPTLVSAGKTPRVFSREDEEFLDDLERRIFDYFWIEIYPETGLAIDHTENRTGKVAATGFGLAAICIGVERGWVSYDDAYERVMTTLNAFWDDPDNPDDIAAEGEFGLWWHFVDGRTGKMEPVDCVAMCDSADLVAGAVVVGEYFKGTEIEELAKKIYDNVEWDQFVSRRSDGSPGLLSFGWVPHQVSKSYYDVDGLLPFNMSGLVDNSLLIYALALGSDTHPIPQATWEEYVDSYTMDEYAGYESVFAGGSFVRQVPQGFIAFDRKRDRKIDYFADTVNALLADRIFNMRVNGYPPEIWGLNDCFGKDTYSHAAPPGMVMNDGTVACTSFEGALPCIPQLSLEAMRYVKEHYGDEAYGKYGFTSSINPLNGFISPRFVGIELGPAIMLLENARSGLIWALFSRSQVMKNFVERAGMSGVIDDFELPPEAPPYAVWGVDDGEVVVAIENPQHGRKCLELKPRETRMVLTAQLPKNDLLDYHFSHYLSIWVRDAGIVSMGARLGGKDLALKSAGAVSGMGWKHFYYALPPTSEGDELECLSIVVDCTGEQPAIDNLTLQAEADAGVPGRIEDLVAKTGEQGGTVRLQWTVPEDSGSDEVATYALRLVGANDGRDKWMTLDSIKKAGELEDRLVSLKSGQAYELTLAATDENGHTGTESEAVEVVANAEVLEGTIDDFSSDTLDKWETATPDAVRMEIRGEGDDKYLHVDFKKSHAWNYLSFEVDPEMVALHRYIRVKVRGKNQFLGKLWCSDDMQHDMEIQATDANAEWSELRFDTRIATQISTSRDRVKKVLLFHEPGDWQASGSFDIDRVEYSNE